MRDCEQRLVTRSECDVEHSIGGALCRCRRVGARRRTAQHSRFAYCWCARVQEVQRDGPIGGAAASTIVVIRIVRGSLACSTSTLSTFACADCERLPSRAELNRAEPGEAL
jgi:hypothetical protein